MEPTANVESWLVHATFRASSAVVLAVALNLGFVAGAWADITSGLVAWFPFDGNANDASGNGHNGVVHGVTLAPDRNGIANHAYFFDGASWIDTSATGLPSAERTQGAPYLWKC